MSMNLYWLLLLSNFTFVGPSCCAWGARNLKFNRIYKFNTVLAPFSGAVTDGQLQTFPYPTPSNAFLKLNDLMATLYSKKLRGRGLNDKKLPCIVFLLFFENRWSNSRRWWPVSLMVTYTVSTLFEWIKVLTSSTCLLPGDDALTRKPDWWRKDRFRGLFVHIFQAHVSK